MKVAVLIPDVDELQRMGRAETDDCSIQHSVEQTLRMNLHRRNISLDTICPFCRKFDEDGGHLFLKCKFAKNCWRAANLETLRILLLSSSNALEVISVLLSQMVDSLNFAAVLLWNIWSARNALIADDCSINANELVSKCQRQVLDFAAAVLNNLSIQSSGSLRWIAPPLHFLKINVDGAFSAESREGGWGFCIRNADGVIQAAGMGRLQYLANALHAETIACLRALRFAATSGLDNLILEADALNLIQAMQSSGRDLSILGVLFQQIRSLLNSFSQCSSVYCNRVCNKVAHMLARKGARLAPGSNLAWHSVIPDFVASLAASDLAVLAPQ